MFQALPWPAFVAAGGWAGYAFLGPQLLELSQTAGLQLDSPWLSLELAANLVGNDRRGVWQAIVVSGVLNRVFGWTFYLFNKGVRRLDVALHQDGRGPLAGERPGAVHLRRSAGADVLDLHAHADRIHSRRRTRGICWSTCSFPTRRRWRAPSR